MRRIIDNVLYDTDTADIVYTDIELKRRYYMTKKKRFFVFFNNGVIESVTEESMKDLLGTVDIDKYIEIFGEPEEG